MHRGGVGGEKNGGAGWDDVWCCGNGRIVWHLAFSGARKGGGEGRFVLILKSQKGGKGQFVGSRVQAIWKTESGVPRRERAIRDDLSVLESCFFWDSRAGEVVQRL